ncbi:InlB B-repeat-containing protein [Lachnospiraceae bacterium 45-W7]
MKSEHRKRNRFWSLLLAFVMVFTTAFGSAGPAAVLAATEDDEFEEVAVPNGDFESGSGTAWTFAGATEDSTGKATDYWRIFNGSGTNKTKAYEACSKSGSTVSYTVSQSVTGLQPGTYKASVEAMGGNDAGGSHTTTLTAGGKTVAVTPNTWNVWNTYTTETFAVGEEGTCEISIASEIKGNYINIDNVKLYRLVPQGPVEVDSVPAVRKKVAVGGTFTAPAQVTVLYKNGKSGQHDVAWNETQLAAVKTDTAGSYTVTGTVTVNETEYTVEMTVEVIDESDLVQEVPENGLGSIDFDENWKFYLATRKPEVADGGFAAAGVKDAGDYTTEEIVAEDFDDVSFRTLDVPHDFSIEGEKVSSSSDAQAYLEGGLGYYRKKFTVPAAMQGNRRISLDFEGVYQNSVVYLNGEEIGGYPNGYTGFALDITGKVKYGQVNTLVVKVQNMSPSGRWYTGSGIVRPVHLVIDNQACFNRNGITLSSSDLKKEYTENKTAYLSVNAEGYSESTNSNVRMEVTVFDATGKEVAKKSTADTAINPSTAFSLALEGNDAIEISNVQLWYPWNLGEPYLYTVKTDLYQQINGGSDNDFHLIDSETTEYGFRWAEVAESTSDPDSGGLYINGEYTKVQGVDLHHDAGAVGAASYTDAYEREFEKLMDMGVNAYRTSHCPPSKQAIEVCRRKGILVVEEAFDGWGRPKATYDFGNFFFQEVPAGWAGLLPNGYTQLPEPSVNYSGAKLTWSDWVIQEMVKRDRNEPSIIAWSVGNEVRGCGTKPSWYDVTKYDPLGVNPTAINEYTEAVRLSSDIKAVDASRYVLMGGDQQRSVPAVTGVWGYVNQVLDGYGLNYNTAKSVDGLMSRFSVGEADNALLEKGTKTFFFESESSSQTSSRGVYLDPQFTNTGINQTPGRRGGSNYDNDFASWTMSNEYGLKKDRDRKSFIGQFIWSGFDYLGEPTPYAVYPVGVSSFGTIDTAGFPKDSFYLYQSQWITKTPMVHVLPTNWDQWHEGEEVEVWVNTNQPSAELFLNGKSLGKKSFDEKETAYGKKYYETSEKTQDDKSWGDSSNPNGYTSNGAVLDEGELNSGRLHLTWTVPYEPGTLSVKAYDASGKAVAEDSVATSKTPYTIEATADKTVLAADGSSLSYVECTIVDEDGNMVPDAQDLVSFDVTGSAEIFGVDNGKQESTELYKYGNVESNVHSERTAYNGKVLVILKSGKEAGNAVLTVSAKDLKPVQVPITVTADGTGSAPAAISVTGTEESVEPVVIKVPAGMTPVLPAAVRVNYNSNAGKYSVMKKVTWGTLAEGKAEGTVEGCTQKASATVTEDAAVETDVELATNKASATASFTGNVNNYPEKMVDGDTATTWTNMYNRGASVLLPANSASRKNEYVEFSWEEAQLLNLITLNFSSSRGRAVPSVLEVQYFDGSDWAKAPKQTMLKAGTAVSMQFSPVYTQKVRVYMENATPFTDNGNMEISEASVKLSAESLSAQALLTAGSAWQGGKAVAQMELAGLSEETKVKEIRFALAYDADVFENPQVTLKDAAAGTITTEQSGAKTIYVFTAAADSTASLAEFAEIILSVKEDAAAGTYNLALTDLAVTDAEDQAVEISTEAAEIVIKERPNIGTETYLSDLEWESATSGWAGAEVQKDKYCHDKTPGPISLAVDGAKKTFEKGLGSNADSEIIYDISVVNETLQKNEKLYFQSYVGVDYYKKEANKNGDGMYFIVYGTKDGKETELYRSKLLDTNSEAEYINVDVTGVTTLKLVMDKNVSNSHDNGDWADAKLVKVEASEETVTVTFDADNGTEPVVVSIVSGGKAEKPEDPNKDGFVFAGWYAEGEEEAFDFNTPVTADLTLTAKWIASSDACTITFQNGADTETKVIVKGQTVTKPDDPEKIGHKFQGWFAENAETAFDFETVVTEDLTLIAKWEKNSADVDDYEALGEVVAAAEALDASEYTAESWANLEKALADAKTKAESPTATQAEIDAAKAAVEAAIEALVKEGGTPSDSHTVTFNADNGSENEVQTVADGAKVQQPAEPEKFGHTFQGWFKGDAEEAFDFETAITENLTLTAKWQKISANVDDYEGLGAAIVAAEKLNASEYTEESWANLQRALSDAKAKAESSTATQAEIDAAKAAVEAAIEALVKEGDTPVVSFTVTFNADNGNENQTQEIADGEKASEPDEPEKFGYTFQGWYAEGAEEAFDFETAVTSDLTLTAKWQKISANVEDYTALGEAVAAAEKLNASDYTTESWAYLQQVLSDAKAKAESPTATQAEIDAAKAAVEAAVKALARPGEAVSYTVTFNADNGSAATTQTVIKGNPVQKPVDPVRAGYTFAGWYAQGAAAAFDFNTVITSDLTLTARWVENAPASTPISITSATVKVAKTTYNGKQRKPAVTVTYNGTKLKLNTDYKVSYSNNKKVGQGKIKITGIGNYTGTKNVVFDILPKASKIAKISNKAGRKLVLKLKKSTGAKGYEITYATNKKFKSAKKQKTNKTTVTLKNLKKNKTYYVKVRAYAKSGKKTIYSSSYSKTVKIKVKR